MTGRMPERRHQSISVDLRMPEHTRLDTPNTLPVESETSDDLRMPRHAQPVASPVSDSRYNVIRRLTYAKTYAPRLAVTTPAAAVTTITPQPQPSTPSMTDNHVLTVIRAAFLTIFATFTDAEYPPSASTHRRQKITAPLLPTLRHPSTSAAGRYSASTDDDGWSASAEGCTCYARRKVPDIGRHMIGPAPRI